MVTTIKSFFTRLKISLRWFWNEGKFTWILRTEYPNVYRMTKYDCMIFYGHPKGYDFEVCERPPSIFLQSTSSKRI